MIEVHIDLNLFEITRTEGVPDNPHENIYLELISILWSVKEQASNSLVLLALGSYLTQKYPSIPWKVVAFVDNVEVSRLEFQSLDESAPISRLRSG